MKKTAFSKILVLLSAIALLLTLTGLGTFAEDADTTPVLSVESALLVKGQSATVTVSVKNNPGVLNAVLTVSFNNEHLSLTDVAAGSAFSGLTFTASATNTDGTYPSPCNFLWDGEAAAATADGEILVLTFTATENAVPGTAYPVTLSYMEGDIADGDLNPVSFTVESGTLGVVDYTPGDVNNDGRINGTDVTLVRRHITGGYGVSIITAAADVNADGRINGTDVTLLRRYITGGYGVELLPSPSTCTAHSLEAVAAKAPGCTAAGNTAYWTCRSCEKAYSDAAGNTQITLSATVVPATGHTPGAVATCTTAQNCTTCGEEIAPATGHSPVTDAAVAPGCETTGLTEGSHCDTCGEVLVKQEVVDATGHSPVTDAAVAPGCETTGLTEGSHCGTCGEVLVNQEVVDATGHSPVTDAAVAPGCETTGLTEGSHCDTCGEVLVAQEIVSATGHNYVNGICTDCKANDAALEDYADGSGFGGDAASF